MSEVTGQDGLRDEIAAALAEWHLNWPWDKLDEIERNDYRPQADAVLPVVQRHIDAAREQVAEQIAQEIEAEYVDSPWIRTAINIARQHAKGKP